MVELLVGHDENSKDKKINCKILALNIRTTHFVHGSLDVLPEIFLEPLMRSETKNLDYEEFKILWSSNQHFHESLFEFLSSEEKFWSSFLHFIILFHSGR